MNSQNIVFDKFKMDIYNQISSSLFCSLMVGTNCIFLLHDLFVEPTNHQLLLVVIKYRLWVKCMDLAS